MENLLKIAVSNCNLGDIKRLLNIIPYTTFTSEEGNRLLYKSIENGQTEICKLLLEHKSKLNISINNKIKNKNNPFRNNWYPIHHAIFGNRIEICKLLIYHGADLEVKDYDGNRPFHFATYFNRKNICKLLLNSGANFTARNNHGKTPTEKGLENGYSIGEEIEKEIISEYYQKIRNTLIFIL